MGKRKKLLNLKVGDNAIANVGVFKGKKVKIRKITTRKKKDQFGKKMFFASPIGARQPSDNFFRRNLRKVK